MSASDGKSKSGKLRKCILTITGRDGQQEVEFGVEFDPPIDAKTDQKSGFAAASSRMLKWIESVARSNEVINDED